MSFKKYLAFIKKRNQRLFNELNNHIVSKEIKYGKFVLTIDPNVFNPKYGEGSQILLGCKEYLYGKDILDIGTGSGALALLAAEKANRVIATDISPFAVKCATKNFQKYSMMDKITVRKGNLFKTLKANEKFDKIIFNPPFLNGKPHNFLDMSYYDDHYKSLTMFFNNVHKYLKPKGEIILCFGSAGDINYLNWVILFNGFEIR